MLFQPFLVKKSTKVLTILYQSIIIGMLTINECEVSLMAKDSAISLRVIQRLPRYYRFLYDLKENGIIGLSRFKKSRVLKAVLTVLSLCTFIMIASSAMRMLIYIQYYYLTFLRIFVLWSLVVLFLLFVGVIVYIIKEDFPLFRYAMVVVTCLYIVFSFSHPDYWIAKVNLAGTKEVGSEFFKGEAYGDYRFIADLNADAAPVLLDWIEEEGYSYESYFSEGLTYAQYTELLNDAADKTIAEKKDWCSYLYLRNLQERCEDMSFRKLNFSRWNADAKVRLYHSAR